jgi:hypothetical protein
MDECTKIPPTSHAIGGYSQPDSGPSWLGCGHERVVWSGSGCGVWEWVEEWQEWTWWWLGLEALLTRVAPTCHDEDAMADGCGVVTERQKA